MGIKLDEEGNEIISYVLYSNRTELLAEVVDRMTDWYPEYQTYLEYPGYIAVTDKVTGIILNFGIEEWCGEVWDSGEELENDDRTHQRWVDFGLSKDCEDIGVVAVRTAGIMNQLHKMWESGDRTYISHNYGFEIRE